MNSFNTLLISVILLFCSMLSAANTSEPILLFSISDNKVVRVGAINNTDKSLSLSISGENKERLFEISVRSGESYFEFHDLSNLHDGEYVISLERGQNIIKKSFTIKESTILVTDL